MKSPDRLAKQNGSIDETDRRLLGLIANDARRSLADLARAIGLSAPSVSERLRQLEEAGVIAAYVAEINPAALGFILSALVRIRPMARQLQRVAQIIQDTQEIIECHRTTGDDCFVASAHVTDVAHLERLIDRFTPYAQTNTSIIQSSPVKRRAPMLG